MDSPTDKPIPPFRQDLEINPVMHDNQLMVVISDLMGLQRESVVMPVAMLIVASHFNGKRTANEVLEELIKQKITLSEQEIMSVAEQLEKCGLLETPATVEKRVCLLRQFQESSVRHTYVESRGLSKDPQELAVFMGKFFEAEKGPGNTPSGEPTGQPPLGLVAPHIDMQRGGPVYAWSYQELAKRTKPDVIVALGTAHLGPRSPWVMTKKSYQTPFGPVDVDETLFDAIRQKLWYDPLEEEWVHAKEHSLEFQALWLKYVWRDACPKWVPILCSGFDQFCPNEAPTSVPSIEKALIDIGDILAQYTKENKKVLILAGIDFSHVGKRFGDQEDMTPELEKKVEEADHDSLNKALQLDADAFFMTGIGNGAWRKVCGLSSLYSALRWIKALNNGSSPKSSLLAYDKAPDPVGGVVSFASALFEAQ